MDILNIEIFTSDNQRVISLVDIGKCVLTGSLDASAIEAVVAIGLLERVDCVWLLSELAEFTLDRVAVRLVQRSSSSAHLWLLSRRFGLAEMDFVTLLLLGRTQDVHGTLVCCDGAFVDVLLIGRSWAHVDPDVLHDIRLTISVVIFFDCAHHALLALALRI